MNFIKRALTFYMEFYRLQSVFVFMKNCIGVTDVVMTLLVPAEIVMLGVFKTLRMTWRYPLNNVIW